MDRATREFARGEMAYRSLEWTLAHKPEKGTHFKGRFWVYSQSGDHAWHKPDLTVLYSFTDDEVTLHAVIARPAAK
jgi:hypothetical protein